MPHVSEKERRKKSSEEKDKGFFEFKIALIFEELGKPSFVKKKIFCEITSKNGDPPVPLL